MCWKTTSIDHEIRIQLGLSMNDYVLLDYIYHTQTSPLYGGQNGGWCDTPLSKMVEFFGLSKGAIHGMFKKLAERGFLELEKTKRKTTKKWWVIYKTSVQKMNDEKKERSENEQNRSESERHTLVINNKESLKAANASKPTDLEQKIEDEKRVRKLEFKTKLEPHLEQYGKTILNDFYLYWTESNKGEKKMRFEFEKIFDISRRLNTWFRRSQANKFTGGGAKNQEMPNVYVRPKQNNQQQTPLNDILANASKKMAV